MNDTPVVHVIDDDIGVRKSLQYLFESARLTVKVYESGELFLSDFNPLQPGCLVLDLRMPAMSGIGVLERLRANKSDIPAIVISGHADVSSAISIMKLGAFDLMQKPFEPLDLLAAVRNAITKSIEAHHHRSQQDGWNNVVKTLTPREREMLKLVVSGRSNKQIAISMGISFKTVVNHRAHMMAKTHATNAADLARMSTLASLG
jgi:two-component system, LuxR family, response regulator FixJ